MTYFDLLALALLLLAFGTLALAALGLALLALFALLALAATPLLTVKLLLTDLVEHLQKVHVAYTQTQRADTIAYRSALEEIINIRLRMLYGGRPRSQGDDDDAEDDPDVDPDFDLGGPGDGHPA